MQSTSADRETFLLEALTKRVDFAGDAQVLARRHEAVPATSVSMKAGVKAHVSFTAIRELASAMLSSRIRV